MSVKVLLPREAARYITEKSRHVTIKDAGIEKVAQLMIDGVKKKQYSVKSWKQNELNPNTMDTAAIDWIFLVDTLNFSFWSEDPDKKFAIKYGSRKWTGYWSLCAAVNRALEEGVPITSPSFYAKITSDQLRHVFRSDTPYDIPMFEERLQVLHEAGDILVKKYNGSFVNCIKTCSESAQSLLSLIIEEFPSYRDVATFHGVKVGLYKRAQIVISDIWACFEGQGLGTFNDIDTITMFADYRIPQALVYFGALEYSEELLDLLNKGVMFNSGDEKEVEIRGCSIHAVELITKKTRELMSHDPALCDVKMNAVMIDHYLWDYRGQHSEQTNHIPIHKIRCIYY